MAEFPEPFTVQHEALVPDAVDAMQEPIEAFAPPVEVRVYGWSPPGEDQVIRALETGVKRDIDLYCATPFARHKDRVTLPGEPLPFQVSGYPQDYNHGPFGFTPGYRINLVRVEG